MKRQFNQMNFTEFQVQLRCRLIIKDGFDNEWMQDFYADFTEDYKAGHYDTVKEWAEMFFQEVTLDTHSYCLVSKVGKPIPEAQPLEGVKTAEYYEGLTDSILSVKDISEASMKYAVERGLDSKACINFIHGSEWQSHRAQFATDAKQLKHENDALYIRINDLETRLSAFATDAGGGKITPVNLGVANGIDPCPFCGGKEGETVFLGYNEPRYLISCTTCNVRLIDDRKDKVQAKWNLRNGITFWDKQSWLAEQAPSTHSSSEMVEELRTQILEAVISSLENTTGEAYIHNVCNSISWVINKIEL